MWCLLPRVLVCLPSFWCLCCGKRLPWCVLASFLHVRGQPHSQLLCTTGLAQGLVRLNTGAGSVSVQYSSTELLQPPIVRSIAPLVWDPSVPTAIVIEGERCGRDENTGAHGGTCHARGCARVPWMCMKRGVCVGMR